MILTINILCSSDVDAACDEKIVKEPSMEGASIWRCLDCSEPFKKKQHARAHVESKHLTGFSFPCAHCPTVCFTRGALKMHEKRKHKDPNFGNIVITDMSEAITANVEAILSDQ